MQNFGYLCSRILQQYKLMNQNLIEKVCNLKIVRLIQSAPTPRWIIFSIDLFIMAMVSLLIFVFPPGYFGANPAMRQIGYCLILVMFAGMDLLTGTYKCIVRLSVPYDLIKIFWCIVLTCATVGLTSIIYAATTSAHHLLIGILPLILIGGMAMSLMISLRIVVKYSYERLEAVNSSRKPVIVLGSAINSLALASTLKSEAGGHFNPVALLSLSDSHYKKRINGLPVEKFSPETVDKLFARYNTNTLVFLQTQLEQMRSGLAEQFISKRIKLFMLNQIEEFDINNETSSPNISAHVNAVKIEDLLGRPVIKNENPLIKEMINGKTVLITGAAGSIGSEIVRQVASFGAGRIVLLDQAETPMHDMQIEMEEKYPDVKISLYVADVQNHKRLDQAFSRFKPSYVFHAAAYKHVPMMERNPQEAILTNVMGTKNLADLSLQHGVRKFVMISTDKAVNPTNIMGASKRIAEIYVQSLSIFAQHGNTDSASTQFITTRFGNVLGSNGSVIPLFRRQIENGGPVTLTHRDIIRYFMTIQEACSLVLEAGCMGRGGEIFLFDMGKPIKIYDLAQRMIQLAGLEPDKDIKIVETGLRPGEKLYEELLNDKEKTIPTGNNKIMRAKVREYDFNAITPHIESMVKLAYDGNVHDMVMTMKGLVPEFISNNSIFQDIDKELQQHSGQTASAPHT